MELEASDDDRSREDKTSSGFQNVRLASLFLLSCFLVCLLHLTEPSSEFRTMVYCTIQYLDKPHRGGAVEDSVIAQLLRISKMYSGCR